MYMYNSLYNTLVLNKQRLCLGYLSPKIVMKVTLKKEFEILKIKLKKKSRSTNQFFFTMII